MYTSAYDILCFADCFRRESTGKVGVHYSTVHYTVQVKFLSIRSCKLVIGCSACLGTIIGIRENSDKGALVIQW